MKGKRILFGIMMVAALVILARPSMSNAYTYSGAWLPNDVDIFTMERERSQTGTGSFYMYDGGGDAENKLVLIDDGCFASTTATFTYADNNWKVTTKGEESLSLDLGSNQEFGFYFSDGANYFSYDLIAREQGESYILSDSNTAMKVVVTDAAPVPITTSVFLLGSGVLGVIALGRRRIAE